MPSQPPLDQIRSSWEESWNWGNVKKFVACFQEAFPDLEFAIEDIFSADDRLVIRWVMQGTHTRQLMDIPPTRKCAQLTGISVYRLVEGRAVESWDQVDILNLLNQLDVSPV